jgi:nucleoside 2-deoxyribosyltransferase
VNKPESLYLIGSLRNENVTALASRLRLLGIDVFDDWMSAGPEADDFWKKYEQDRKHSYQEALQGHAARHVFEFDKYHLDRCDAALLVLPAGKSGHLELGYVAGSGKPTYILLDEADVRWDVMYQFADKIFLNEGEMIEYFK